MTSTDDLRADCSRCVGLCCVVPVFTRSSDFAIDKPAGVPCPNLARDSRCTIHASLRTKGFTGCTVFDCFGAGQRAVELCGPDGDRLAETFGELLRAHELLWYLQEVERRLPSARASRLQARAHHGHDPDHLRAEVATLLREVSAALRSAGGRTPDADRAGTDHSGARLTDLARCTLRGARLIGADLRGADLTLTDVLGADLRGADVRGADLSDALFLTQFQVNGMRGDATTRIPADVLRPAHWAG